MNKEELHQAFELAKTAGQFEHAYKIEQQLLQMEDDPVEFSAWRAVKNFPGSVKNVVGEAAHAVANPIDTGNALVSAGVGALEKLGRNFEEFYMDEDIAPTPGKEDAANAVGQFYKDRYGSVNAVKQTAMDDPAGMMLDLSAVGSASKIPVIAKTATVVDPINAAARLGQTAIKIIPQNTAAKLYESAAKFSTTIPKPKRNAMVDVALEHGLLPTQAGVRKVSGRIDVLGSMLDDLIVEAGKSGVKIPVSAVERHIRALKASKGGFRLGRGDDIAKIDKILTKWRKDVALLGREMGGPIKSVTPEFMQSFKRDAYADVNWKAKRPGAKASQITEETYKTMARGAKDAVADVVPEAGEINKLLGEMLELQPELIRAANRIDNRNLIGLDTSVKVGTGLAGGAAVDAAGLGAAIGMALSLLGNPKIKPRIAVALRRLRDGDINWLDRRLGDPAVRAALVLAGRAEEIVDAPNYGAEDSNQDQPTEQASRQQAIPQQPK